MIRKNITEKTSIRVNNSYEGETIESKIERILTNNEPITDGAPPIYTERKHGVRPEYNIRTDRWDLAIDAMDYVAKSNIAKRENAIKEREMKIVGGKEVGGAESIQATE